MTNGLPAEGSAHQDTSVLRGVVVRELSGKRTPTQVSVTCARWWGWLRTGPEQ